ncbi:MAG: DNA-binding transcriptional regulator, partial [bacterium]|nr:DNA-binding transcriptional regulator [bacterium]
MSKLKHVALLIETSRAYGRGLLRGVSRYNHEQGRWSLYFKPQGLDDPPPPWLKDWNGDGILARINDRRMAAAVVQTGVPVVELRRLIPDLGLPSIGADNRAVTELAVGHLLERGFQHFAFCGLPKGEYPPMDERREWFVQLIEEAGFQQSVFDARRTRRRGDTWTLEQNEIAEWLGSLAKPVGVMACNDDRGLQVLDACHRAGLMVPDEVAVVGVDNDDYLCNLSVPQLTSVDLAPDRMGYEAAKLLDRMMAGGVISSPQISLPPRGVVTRQSTDVLATEDQVVIRAVRFIRERACDRIQVADVLEHVRVSRSRLEPRLKEVLGRTIHQEILRVQIEQVKELLIVTDLPIKQIANRCGFTESQYLSR